VREFIKFGLLLGLLCGISAGILTAVYSVVSVRIEENNRLEAIRKRQAVLPEAVRFELYEDAEPAVYLGIDNAERTIGTAFTVSSRGYGGLIRMTLGIGMDGKLSGLAISKLDQIETPGLGVKITYPSFLDQFRGKEPAQLKLRKEGGEVDAITAATISSRAVAEGTRKGMEWFLGSYPDGPEGIRELLDERGAASPAGTEGAE
jgi:electron transport complex protein RnfG